MPERTRTKPKYRHENPGKAGALGGSGLAGAIIIAFHLPPEWAALLSFLPPAAAYAYTWLVNSGGLRGVWAKIIGARPNR